MTVCWSVMLCHWNIGAILQLLVLLLLQCIQVSAQRRNVTYQQDGANSTFLHLVFFNDSGVKRLYIGAKNEIIELRLLQNETFMEYNVVTTGPKNVECSPRDSCDRAVLTDNYNKILLLNQKDNSLITCGTLFQGSCEQRNVSNISIQLNCLEDVTPNERNESTLAFLIPRNVSYIGGRKKMIVGVTNPRLKFAGALTVFSLAGEGFEGKRMLRTERNFKMVFRWGFELGEYVYIITNQPDHYGGTTFVTKIQRMCVKETSLNANFKTIMDIQIRCSTSGSGHQGDLPLLISATLVNNGTEKVLVAFFTDAADPANLTVFNKSGVCYFTMKSVDEKFQENINDCLKTGREFDTRRSYWRSPLSNCPNASRLAGNSSCALASLFRPFDLSGLIGIQHLTGRSVLIVPNEIQGYVTAMQSATLNDGSTVLFLGTSRGSIFKAHLDMDRRNIAVYSNTTVEDNSPIKEDLLLDDDVSPEKLYAMTSKVVTQLPVQDCKSHPTCAVCLRSRDPYCGWCVEKGRCVVKEDCSLPGEALWLHAIGNKQCMKVEMVDPEYVAVNNLSGTNISLKLNFLSPSSSYFCKFSSDRNQQYAPGKVTENRTLQCPTPSEVTFKGSQKSVMVEIWTKSPGSEFVPLVNTSINIVNCAVSHTCSSCVDLQACFWCIYENKCTNNDSLCPSPSDSASPPYVSVKKANCPEATFDIITVPNGAERQMKATGTNLPAPQNGFYYTCTVPSINLTVGATHDNETSVTCSSAPLKSTDPSPELVVKVQLLWQSSGTPPAEFAMKEVTMYRCDLLGTDCSTCGSYNKPMNKQKDYGCTWCGYHGCGHKEIQTTCSKTACPAPTIIKVNPLFAHSFGGTMVTIKGKELGRWIKDVRNVTLAGQPCELVPEGFQVSKQITCRTKNGSKGYAPILVTVQNKTSPSRENFTFSNPQVNSVFPVKGPKAGGTRLTITGRNLWIGNQRSAYLGSGNGSIILRQCSMVNKMPLVCLTPAVEDPGNFSTLTVSIDGHGFTARSYVFEYTENPKVVQLEPLKSIRSGGRTITVTGVTLDSILSPAWFVRKENLCSEMQLCSHSKESNSTIMYCPSPSLAVPNWKNCSSRGVIGGDTSVRRRRETSDNTTKLRLGFLMDGVSNDDLDIPSLIYVNDPTYNKLKEKSYFKPNTLLYLSGNNLDDAATVDDVRVWICNSSCIVTNLNKTNLRCSQPKEAVGCEKSGKAVYTVKVEVGKANYFVGKLIEEVFPVYIIIVCVVIIFALIGAFLIVTIKLIRQKRKHQQDIEQKQQEYLMLETKVRTGAREEFAGLQQDIRLVTSDVVRTGVPYKPLAHYTFSMLFPADIMAENTLLNHSQSNGDCGNRHERAIGLESLIGNKFFLLTTLRCLEAQKKLSSKDKSSLANVLTVILLDRLEYLMEIWKELMQEFVARSIDKKQQKQIMRRNDSIVEKLLSNWIALCMYDNMKNHTGASLFMLYISTEMLTNYGPADAVTGDTYYTLCEEKILKKNLDVEYLNIRVLVNGEEFTCKVLECDTVTQTKQKFLHQIYKSVPTSSRPRADQVDLEWHWGSNGRLILDDFDNTTEGEGDWNRLNTLKHYNVKDYSVMALLSKEEGMESDNPYGNCISSRNNLLAIEGINVNMHSRIWHLVKPEDEYEENKQREIFEIYLPRLMSTKVHLIQYMDAFVDSVFDPSFVPVSVKYLFDFFDELAQRHGIQDSDVVHTWKSNSLPIRYWGSLLKAPHHVFDVQPPDLSEPSLEVLAQCFIDGCYNTELRLGKDSPASKLLFSRDLPRYREAVAKFYSGVKASSTVTREEVVDEVQQLSAKLRQDNLFSKKAALRELSETIKDYHEEVISALEENQESKTLQLGHKLEDYLESLAS